MKEAKPLKIWARPEDNWSNEYNQFDAYGIQFDGDGDMGVFSVVQGNSPKFKIGESAHYTMEDKGKHPNKITFKDPQYDDQQGPPFVPRMEVKDLPLAESANDRVRSIVRQKCIESAAIYTAQRTAPWEPIAEDMFNWVMKPESVEAKEIVNDLIEEEDKPPF